MALNSQSVGVKQVGDRIQAQLGELNADVMEGRGLLSQIVKIRLRDVGNKATKH